MPAIWYEQSYKPPQRCSHVFGRDQLHHGTSKPGHDCISSTASSLPTLVPVCSSLEDQHLFIHRAVLSSHTYKWDYRNDSSKEVTDLSHLVGMTSSWHAAHLSCPQFSQHVVKVRGKKNKQPKQPKQNKNQGKLPSKSQQTKKKKSCRSQLYLYSVFSCFFLKIFHQNAIIFLKMKISKRKRWKRPT